MAGWYEAAERYQISSWLLGCLESEIDSHVKDERNRIIKLAKNRICFDHAQGCDHQACYALSDLITVIEGEQK